MAARHVFLIIADLLSIFLFSGILFGWAPLNDMLIKEGFYSELCGDEALPCEKQKNALNSAFTLAATMVSLVALPGGIFVDKCGPLVGSVVAGFLNITALAGFILCKAIGSAQFDVFLVSFLIMAVGGSLTMFCGYSLPFLFPSRCTLLIELTSCLFDASCIVFTFFKIAYDNGAAFQTLFGVYVGVCVVNFVLLAVAWALNRTELWESKQQLGSAESDVTTEPGLQSKPLGQQVRSLPFLVILVFSAMQMARANLYLGVVDSVDKQYADNIGASEETVNQMTIIVVIIISQGWVAVPLIELSIHRLGVFGTLNTTVLIGLLYNVCQLIPNLPMQYVGAALFSVFRAFLYSIITAYNAEMFGPKTLGRIMGIVMCFSALVNLAQIPLVQMSHGNYTPLNIGSSLITLPLPLLVLAVQASRRRQALACPEEPNQFAVPLARQRSLANTVPSRTYSHSTAACTAGQLMISAAIERSLAQEANRAQQVVETGMASPMGE